MALQRAWGSYTLLGFEQGATYGPQFMVISVPKKGVAARLALGIEASGLKSRRSPGPGIWVSVLQDGLAGYTGIARSNSF